MVELASTVSAQPSLPGRTAPGAAKRGTGAASPHITPGTPLTAREQQVIALAAQGCLAKEIGEQLGISWRTVEIHRANAIYRLGARNVTHAAVLFDRLGTPGLDENVEAEQFIEFALRNVGDMGDVTLADIKAGLRAVRRAEHKRIIGAPEHTAGGEGRDA